MRKANIYQAACCYTAASVRERPFKLQEHEIDKAERTELSELRDDLKELNDKFATKEEVREVKETMSKITKDIDFIKEKSVRSDEFVRVIGRLESKLDDLLRR